MRGFLGRRDAAKPTDTGRNSAADAASAWLSAAVAPWASNAAWPASERLPLRQPAQRGWRTACGRWWGEAGRAIAGRAALPHLPVRGGSVVGTGVYPHGVRKLAMNLGYIFRLYFIDPAHSSVAASRSTGGDAPLAVVCRGLRPPNRTYIRIFRRCEFVALQKMRPR